MIEKIRKSGVVNFLALFTFFAVLSAPVFTVFPAQAHADTETVVVDDDIDDDDDGVFEEIFDAVGYVLALPFRIVAGVFEAIF